MTTESRPVETYADGTPMHPGLGHWLNIWTHARMLVKVADSPTTRHFLAQVEDLVMEQLGWTREKLEHQRKFSESFERAADEKQREGSKAA